MHLSSMKNKDRKVKRMVRFSTVLDFKFSSKSKHLIGWRDRSLCMNLKPFLVFPENKTVPIEISIPVKHDISNDSNVEKPKS